MADHTLFTFPAAKAFASGKVIICQMLVERLADEVDCNIKSNVRNCLAWISQVFQKSVPYVILHWLPASGWTRNFRLDYVELP